MAEGEEARQEEARERIRYGKMNEKLAMRLDNFKSVLSTLQEQDEYAENPSARIAEDPWGREFMVKEEEENEAGNPLVLGCGTVYYSAQDVDEFQQEWQEMHQQELLDVQQCMQAQMNAQLARSRGQ